MISCTEFIPAYSELFKFIDQESGRQAVYDYWKWNFQPEKSPLNKYLDDYKMRGCWEYWSVIHIEEACDNTMFYNEEEGWFASCMHSCPSKGRFDKLGYMTPFDEYCKHCDGYDWSLEKHGYHNESDYRGEDHACCRNIIVDPKIFKGDQKAMLDQMYRCEMAGCKYDTEPEKCPMNKPGTMVLRTSPKSLEYFHPGFHPGMDRGAAYIRDIYGMDGLKRYLTQFVKAFHIPTIDKIKEQGLKAVVEYLTWLYETEKAPEVLHMDVTENEVKVKIDYCPAVKYMKESGHTPADTYEYCTSMVYEALANESGIGFEMISYDHDTGAAEFRFFTK